MFVASAERKMKLFHGKLGTVPANMQFRYAYKFRPGLRVVYRVLAYTPFGIEDYGPWQTGIVEKIEPVLFITRL